MKICILGEKYTRKFYNQIVKDISDVKDSEFIFRNSSGVDYDALVVCQSLGCKYTCFPSNKSDSIREMLSSGVQELWIYSSIDSDEIQYACKQAKKYNVLIVKQ